MGATKWVELIRVRSNAEALAVAMPDLQNQLSELRAPREGGDAMLLQHALYDGDLAVVLVWQDHAAPRRTRSGLLVAQQLERLGSVDHAVWVPASSEGG